MFEHILQYITKTKKVYNKLKTKQIKSLVHLKNSKIKHKIKTF